DNMAGLNAFQGDCGDIRAHAIAVEAGGDGHCLSGSDQFELILKRFDEWAVGCPAPARPGIDAPEGAPRWIGMPHSRHWLVGDVVESDVLPACQAMIDSYC